MTTKQVVLTALILALVCCAVMWYLESFRMARIAEEWRSMIAGLPSVGEQPAT